MKNIYSMFQDAVIENDIETIKKYIDLIDPTFDEDWPMAWASSMGRIEVVRLLLSDPRVNPSEHDNRAIGIASENGQAEVVRLLLSDPRVDPSADNNWAIGYASELGHLEVVKLLLSDSRVDPSAKDDFAIRRASKNGHIEIVRLLLSDPRVDIDHIENEEMKKQLLKEKEERKKLQKEWISAYRSIEKTSPQVTYDGKSKTQIPKEIIKNIVYRTAYQELCTTIPGNIPPVKLLALADLLKIEYNRNTSYTELCGKIKLILLNKLL